jgi:hypothetical protein
MTTAITTTKSTGLAKTGEGVRHLATRIERARQSRNEKVARADAEFVEAIRRAIADLQPPDEGEPAPSITEPVSASA